MLIQGTNVPLVIEFDQDLSQMHELIVTAWTLGGTLLKQWKMEDLTIDAEIVTCPLTEAESKTFPNTAITIEAKGLNEDGETIFWDSLDVAMKRRRDKDIPLEESNEVT